MASRRGYSHKSRAAAEELILRSTDDSLVISNKYGNTLGLHKGKGKKIEATRLR